jgi:hypothetical protein
MQLIGLCRLISMRSLLGLATRRAASGVVLCGRGNLSTLNLAVGVVFSRLNSPRAL